MIMRSRHTRQINPNKFVFNTESYKILTPETYSGYKIDFFKNKKSQWRSRVYARIENLYDDHKAACRSFSTRYIYGPDIVVEGETKKMVFNSVKKIIDAIQEEENMIGISKGTIARKPIEGALKYGSQEFVESTKLKIREHNNYAKSSHTFVFPNYGEALLWIDEFLGQISDGKYENTSNTKWKWFHDLKVEVKSSATKAEIIGYIPSHAYMSFSDLIWLFDGNIIFKEEPGSARAVMSTLPTPIIQAWIKDINRAVNRK